MCNPLTSAVSPGRCHPWGLEGAAEASSWDSGGVGHTWGGALISTLTFRATRVPRPKDQEMEAQEVLPRHGDGLARDVLELGLLLPENETVSAAGGKQNRFSGDGRLNPVTSVWVQPLESPIPLYV